MWRCGATTRSGPACPAGCWRCCSTILLLLAAPHGARIGRAVGRARGAPPEPGLQPEHRAAPDQFGALLGWPFYVPMALAGVPPLVFGVVALVDLLYQFWVHTEQVGKLGWFDRWFCSPSNHRAPRGERCVSGQELRGILILWDRLWHFQRRRRPREVRVWHPRSTEQLDPLWANAQVYAGLAHDSWHARRWADKSRSGSSHRAGARRWRSVFPNPPSAWRRCRSFSRPCHARCSGLRWCSLRCCSRGGLFLWQQADTAPLAHNAIWFAVLLVGNGLGAR